MSDLRTGRVEPSKLQHVEGCYLDGPHRGPCRINRPGHDYLARQKVIEEIKHLREQMAPKPNNKKDIQTLVIEDLFDRRQQGIERYGTPLQLDNGRDMLFDLYQELIDAVFYIRGLIEERNNKVG